MNYLELIILLFREQMAWIADASLASAVSNAGGLGIIACGNADAEWVRSEIRKTKELTKQTIWCKRHAAESQYRRDYGRDLRGRRCRGDHGRRESREIYSKV